MNVPLDTCRIRPYMHFRPAAKFLTFPQDRSMLRAATAGSRFVRDVMRKGCAGKRERGLTHLHAPFSGLSISATFRDVVGLLYSPSAEWMAFSCFIRQPTIVRGLRPQNVENFNGSAMFQGAGDATARPRWTSERVKKFLINILFVHFAALRRGCGSTACPISRRMLFNGRIPSKLWQVIYLRNTYTRWAEPL